MVKYFLVILSLFPFFAGYSQNKVCIQKETAVYFLEQEERAKILTEKDSLNQEQIKNLGNQLLVKDEIIILYKQDSVSYNNKTTTIQEQLSFKEEELKISKKEIRRQKFLKTLGFIGIGVITILAFI